VTDEPIDPESLSMQVDRSRRHTRTLEIIIMYLNGVPIDKITDTFKMSRGQVLRYARLAGLPKRPKGFDPEIKAKTLKLYKDGMSLKRISARLGVSEAYISKTAHAEGLQLRKPRREHKLPVGVYQLSKSRKRYGARIDGQHLSTHASPLAAANAYLKALRRKGKE